jgi:DNA-binding transcriptional ArsR family regulator
MLDHTLTALADPTRRAILKRLAHGEARVTQLAAPFAISLNSVSKHIKLLERAELVERRRSGREHILRFRPEPLSAVQEWIADQQAFWGAGLKALDDLLQDDDRARSGRHARKPGRRKG